MGNSKEKLLEFCNKWLEDWSTLEPEKVLPYYDENCYFWEPAIPDGAKNKAEFTDYLLKIKDKFMKTKWICKELFPIEEGFTFRWEAHLTSAKSGETEVLPGLELVMLKDGKIIRNEVYYDRTRLMKGKTIR